MTDTPMREVEIRVHGTWVTVEFTNLKRGDLFRLWEPDVEGNRNALVACPECGHTTFRAMSNPYEYGLEGVLSIQSKCTKRGRTRRR